MDRQLSLGDYLGVLRTRWKIVVGTFAVVMGLAVAYSLLTTPLYRAHAALLIDNDGVSGGLIDDQTGQRVDENRIIETEVAFVTSRLVQDAVDEQLGVETTVAAQGAADANVIEITVEGDDAEEAAVVANTYAETYIELRRQQAVDEFQKTADVVQARIDNLDEELGGRLSDEEEALLVRTRDTYVQALETLRVGADLFAGVNPQLISRAEPPSEPFVPQTGRNLMLAAVVGLIAGVGLALLRETLDTSIRTKRDLEDVTGDLPTLAMIPSVDGWKERDGARILSIEQPDSHAAEAYRTLRTAMQFLSLDRTLKIVQVTSPKPGEGKSTTTANLAVAFARAGKKVVVVDCDLRKPRAHKFFEIDPIPGVANILLGEMEPSEVAARPIPELPILVIPAGPLAPNPSEALGSSATYQFFDKLRKAADIVLVDSPPILPVADPRVLADKVDATIIVTQSKGSSKPEVARALELLQQVNAPVVGTVLNKVGKRAGVTYGYGYRYTYGETAAAEDSAPPAGKSTVDLTSNGKTERSALAALLDGTE